MKSAFLFSLFFSFFASPALAAINGYDIVWPRLMSEYFEKVDAALEANRGLPAQCPRYNRIVQKGSLDFRYALGYFDESWGIDGASEVYGYSPSLDIIAFDVIREFLKRPCERGSLRRSCGFHERGQSGSGAVELSRMIEINGSPVRVHLNLTHASASELYLDNLGPLSARQATLTAQSEENFFGGLSAADVIFYNGHSRDGGGPDFKPPVLLDPSKKPNYPFYQKRKEGFKKMTQALKEAEVAPLMVGLFSCYTKKHFQKPLAQLAPKQALVLSAAAIDYLNTLLASMGYLEAILQGECGARAARLAKQNHHAERGFFDLNFQ